MTCSRFAMSIREIVRLLPDFSSRRWLPALAGLMIAPLLHAAEPRFDWSATLSAPQEHPVEVLKGSVSTKEYRQEFASWNVVNPGWGLPGGAVVVGPASQAMPERLELTWLSLSEKRTYQGDFVLPTQAMIRRVRKGFHDAVSGRRQTYDTLVIGLAPEGRVVVWLRGGEFQVEVAIFQAKPILAERVNLPVDDRYRFEPGYVEAVMRDDMIIKPEIAAKLARVGFPAADVYERYRRPYAWRPKVVLPAGSRLIDLSVRLVSGEAMVQGADAPLAGEARALPYVFFITWQDETGLSFGAWTAFTLDDDYWLRYRNGGIARPPLDFDESDFSGLLGVNAGTGSLAPFDIVMTPDPVLATVEVSIARGGQTAPLRDVRYLIGRR